MSNATDTPRKPGQQRRRRSRGGKNRNQNRNQNQPQTQGQPKRSHEGGNNGGRPRRRRNRTHKPVKLTFWQKLLKLIGLYDESSARKGDRDKSKDSHGDKSTAQAGDKTSRPLGDKTSRPLGDKTSRPPKSNTRNARSSDDGEGYGDEPAGKRSDRDKRRRGGDPSTVESSRVYVGNLSYDVTEEDLKELFKGVGTVRRVEIVYNRNTHRSKGYGFVEMMNKDDAMRSVEVLHDQPFMGRNMTVSGAKNKGEDADEDQEPVMEIKASDVQLAPLPEKSVPEVAETAAASAESTTEATAQESSEPATEPQAGEEERKQD